MNARAGALAVAVAVAVMVNPAAVAAAPPPSPMIECPNHTHVWDRNQCPPPPRARRADRRDPMRLHIPEGWKHKSPRHDRSRMYVCIMAAMLVTATSMLVVGPIPSSSLNTLDTFTQQALAAVLWIGTATCLYGTASGSRWFRRNADLRNCYRMAIYATPSNVAALAIYVTSIAASVHWAFWLSALGAGFAAAVMVGHIFMAWDLWWEVERITARVSKAVDAAVEQLEVEADHDR